MARSRPYAERDFEYIWDSVGGDDSLLPRKSTTPVVYIRTRHGQSGKLVFSSWTELQQLVSTLQGELNAQKRRKNWRRAALVQEVQK